MQSINNAYPYPSQTNGYGQKAPTPNPVQQVRGPQQGNYAPQGQMTQPPVQQATGVPTQAKPNMVQSVQQVTPQPQGYKPQQGTPTQAPQIQQVQQQVRAPYSNSSAPMGGNEQERTFEDNQILKLDGNGVFVEVLRTGFEYEKVRFQFMSYDKNGQAGSKKKDFIGFNLTFEEFLNLGYEVLNLEMRTLVPDQYRNLKIYLKGTPSKFNGGVAISRKLEIKTGDHYPIRLVVSEGPGKEISTGLIQPDGKPTSSVTVPLSIENFRSIFLRTNMEIQTYLTQQATQRALDEQFEKIKKLLGK